VVPGADGFPTRQDCAEVFSKNPFAHGWATGQGTLAAGHAYDSLFLNVNNMTEAWGAFWAKTASAVKGLDNVLGFELMNEPFAGDPFTHPLLMEPGRADWERLQPAYDVVVRHIRAVDDATLVFFDGVTWDSDHPVGFTAAPGGAQEANRSVLSYHYYIPPQGTDFETYLRARRQDARRLGTGLMMTESCCDQLYNLAVPALGAVGHSWIHWEWKDWCREDDTSLTSPSQNAAWGACKTGFGAGPWSEGSTSPDPGVMAQLSVPYLPAVAGTLGGTSWNASTGVFTATFRPDPGLAAPTEALVSPVSFPAGFDVAVEPAVLAVERRPEAARVLLTPLANASASQAVTVTITRRSPGAAEVLLV
jgi:endoglycosylceramidase